jgi:hypothetical protein
MLQQREQDKEFEKQANAARDTLIEEQVLHRLGTPDDLCNVQVRRLWKDHFRVNVFIGATPTSAKIANSYFIVLDGDGSVVESVPTIVKQY